MSINSLNSFPEENKSNLKYASSNKDKSPPGLLNESVIKSVKKIFELNIVQGDALSFKCGEKLDKPIVLPEWSLIDNSLKRRDFAYKDFISYAPIDCPNLFSDLGEKAFLPEPIKDWPLTKYYKIYEFKR